VGRVARVKVPEIEGEGAVWGAAGFAASILLGVGLQAYRQDIGLENVVVLYLIVIAATAAVGGRAAGLISSLSAALAFNWFFTSPYHTLRVDSARQVLTVALLFAAGLLASLGGRSSRVAGAAAREEAAAIRALTAVNLAAASGRDADQVAARELLDLLGARAVTVLRGGPAGDRVSASAGEPDERLDPTALPRLDEEGRIPAGHRRTVDGLFVLPAEGVAVDLLLHGRRVGALVIEPSVDHPLLRTTRMAVAAAAHALSLATAPSRFDPFGGEPETAPPNPPIGSCAGIPWGRRPGELVSSQPPSSCLRGNGRVLRPDPCRGSARPPQAPEPCKDYDRTHGDDPQAG
jgi:K+-sensing histidine kinase KdpD